MPQFPNRLISAREVPRRYLWTDAFAVCNFLELYRQTSDEKYKRLALRLVDQVHHVLGRHRDDDPRAGWISGLDEKEGAMHPTRGGLRIGKGMNERRPDDPYDEQLEWDRDGQYYHYLTKWMHALERVSRVTGDPTYRRWAIELVRRHARFTYIPHRRPETVYWKMSIDFILVKK
jgi:rhamnogalacturonyl hydrolase YesR